MIVATLPKSNAEVLNQHYQDVQELVIAILEWTPEQYFAHQFEQYEDYLFEKFVGQPVALLDEFRYSPLVRAWFVNRWNMRNDSFIDRCEVVTKTAWEVQEYMFSNRAKTLLKSPVMNSSFDEIYKLVTATLRKELLNV